MQDVFRQASDALLEEKHIYDVDIFESEEKALEYVWEGLLIEMEESGFLTSPTALVSFEDKDGDAEEGCILVLPSRDWSTVALDYDVGDVNKKCASVVSKVFKRFGFKVLYHKSWREHLVYFGPDIDGDRYRESLDRRRFVAEIESMLERRTSGE